MVTEAPTSDDLIQQLEPDLTQYSQQMHAAVRQQDHEAFVRAYEDFCTVADGIGHALGLERPAQLTVFPAGILAPGPAEQALLRLQRLPMYYEDPRDNG